MLLDCDNSDCATTTTRSCVTRLGVDLDAEQLTFATHVKRVSAKLDASTSSDSCGLFPPAAFSADNVKMLVHVLVVSRADYCNGILYQVAAVHLRPLQSVLNAAARPVVKKRECVSHQLFAMIYTGCSCVNEWTSRPVYSSTNTCTSSFQCTSRHCSVQ